MDEITELEQRLSDALTTIGDAPAIAETLLNGQGDERAQLEQELADKDARLSELAEKEQAARDMIAELSSQAEDLRAKLSEAEENMRKLEAKRKEDLAELDEIIDQLEPLLGGEN